MTGGTVIVLGKTGRNFAAGMSGGRAFVLDLDHRLVNPELVDILSLPEDQEEMVRKNISKFFAETGSKIAGELSKNWTADKSRISLVMPRDYARVLEVMAKAERSGLSAESEVMAVLNG
jgi:glutamate synthase (NADPH/NADH) large chain